MMVESSVNGSKELCSWQYGVLWIVIGAQRMMVESSVNGRNEICEWQYGVL